MAPSVSLLLKLLNGRLLMESMPLIQKLLQRDTGSPGSGVQPGPVDSNMSLHSSLPESAFLDILSALKPLPDFLQLLATANEHGQTLLHLAVDLRYRKLVQKLIHWRVDPNVRDVNGFTALHVAYLCDDPFVIDVLRAGGATPFILDELSRSPIGLSSQSDRQRRQQAASLRDARLQTREDVPAGDEVDPTDRRTEVEEVTPDRGPTTGGVRKGSDKTIRAIFANYTLAESIPWPPPVQ